MGEQNIMLYARTNMETKVRFEEICKGFGTTSSQAIRDYVKYVCQHNEFPIPITKKVSPIEIMRTAVDYYISERGKGCVVSSSDLADVIRATYGEDITLPPIFVFCYNVCIVGFVNPTENRLLEMVDRDSFKCLGYIDDYTGPVYKHNHHGYMYLQIGEFNNGRFRLYGMNDFIKNGDRFAPWVEKYSLERIEEIAKIPYIRLKRFFMNYLTEEEDRSVQDAKTLASDAFYMYRVYHEFGEIKKFWDLIKTKDPEKMYEAFVKFQVDRGREPSSPSYASYRRAFNYLYRFLYMKR